MTAGRWQHNTLGAGKSGAATAGPMSEDAAVLRVGDQGSRRYCQNGYKLPFMGLTVFNGKRPLKSEVGIAKNYMTEKELFALRRMVNAFFDMAELKAETQEPMYMRDWLATLDKFTRDFGFGVLECSGTVSHIDAIEKAHREYDVYRRQLADDLSDVEKAYLETLRDMQKRLMQPESDATIK
jgi:hypothetical protein